MDFFYFVLFICALPSVFCTAFFSTDCKESSGKLELETYGAYLIGFTMLIMLIIIICLSVALYMIKNKKSMFGINCDKKPDYIRQESSQGIKVCNYTTSNTGNDMCRNNGSTLTVNSGIVEIGGLVEPETPTPQELRVENRTPIIKKPKGPILPTIQKEQMDNIIKQVLLNRRQKSESATLNELDVIANTNVNECMYANTQLINMANESKNDTKVESKDLLSKSPNLGVKKSPQLNRTKMPAFEVHKSPKFDGKTEVDGMQHTETKLGIDDDEQEVYDTVPNPVRCNMTSEDNDFIQNMPVYDLPPARNWNMGENSNVVMDSDSDYLLLMSKNVTEDEENVSYINAKVHEKYKPKNANVNFGTG